MTTAMPGADPGSPTVSMRLNPRRRRSDARMRYAFVAAAVLTFLITALIVATLALDAGRFIVNVDLSSLWEIGFFPRRGLYDIKTLVVGTLIVTVIAMLVAAPLGIAAAVYLSEYARPGVRRVLKPIIEVLAGVPSVVLGYFAIAFINPNLVVRFFESANRSTTLAAASIGVGVLTIPIIASVAEDALTAVPGSLREASYGLGGRRLTTTFRVVLPAATSGVVAALILGVSRAVGETMVLAIAAGAGAGGLFRLNPLETGTTLTAAMASLGFGSDQVAGANLAFQSLYFLGALLFLITFGLNVAGDRLVRRLREEY